MHFILQFPQCLCVYPDTGVGCTATNEASQRPIRASTGPSDLGGQHTSPIRPLILTQFVRKA